ncbi:MAG TPA: hypothetical protein VNL73_11575 [Verrucomicrobiae bacterium]|nr:hypothetical protein [Verrucomicrobiae bacterium]
MSSPRAEIFERLAQQSEEFLAGWAQREAEGLKTFKQIWRLKELAYRPIEEFPDLAERFRLFEQWLGTEGMELASTPLTRYQMEEVSAALEKLKLFLPRNGEGTEAGDSGDHLAELSEKFVARLTGREAKPPAFAAKTGHFPSGNDRTSGDLSEDFQKLLGYELEYMREYRKPGEHPLSVIGRLLDALTARYHLADEVFVAHLLYFLQAQNYPVGPYLEKFRQVKSRVKK